jgi:hypothetical protein
MKLTANIYTAVVGIVLILGYDVTSIWEDIMLKKCKACGVEFRAGGRGGKKLRATFCSRKCHQRSRYRLGTQCKDLTEGDTGYVAGFMDGEGSIILFERENGSVGLILDLSGTVREPIDWLLGVTGIGYHACQRRRSPRHRTCYSWRAGGEAAESLLRKIVGLLKVKRRQAEMGIAFQERLRDPALKADRTWQLEWMARMKAMNARGPVVAPTE